MYEGLLQTFMHEMYPLSGGQLNCLPHARALLDFFEARGAHAIPLVVRCVVFGRRPEGDWNGLPMPELVQTALNGTVANGVLEFAWPRGVPDARNISVRFRTLGFTHGHGELGSYSASGRWSGHLVVVTNGIVLDPTIGQLNHADYGIDFDPPFEVIEADEGFLAGREPIVGESAGKWVYYRAYPDERSYEQAGSWTDASFRQQLKEVGLRVAQVFEAKPDAALHEVQPRLAAPARPAPQPQVAETPSTRLPNHRVGRNDRCPCGSGRKYKKCCGR